MTVVNESPFSTKFFFGLLRGNGRLTSQFHGAFIVGSGLREFCLGFLKICRRGIDLGLVFPWVDLIQAIAFF